MIYYELSIIYTIFNLIIIILCFKMIKIDFFSILLIIYIRYLPMSTLVTHDGPPQVSLHLLVFILFIKWCNRWLLKVEGGPLLSVLLNCTHLVLGYSPSGSYSSFLKGQSVFSAKSWCCLCCVYGVFYCWTAWVDWKRQQQLLLSNHHQFLHWTRWFDTCPCQLWVPMMAQVSLFLLVFILFILWSNRWL